MKHLAREKLKLDEREMAKKMINPYYLTDRAFQVGVNLKLDSHLINHSKSNLTIKPYFPEFGVDIQYFKKNLKEMAIIYAWLKNQKKLK